MSRSKKEQVNIKLEFARGAISSAIETLENELALHTKDEIRNTPDLYRKHLKLVHYQGVLVDIMKLYNSASGKKQKTRMILAVCSGELKGGEPCLYKIRASMSMYLRGIPACPDTSCNRHKKPLEVDIADEDIDTALAQTLGEEIMTDLERADKRRKEAQEKFGKKTRSENTDDDLTRAQDDEWLKDAGKL